MKNVKNTLLIVLAILFGFTFHSCTDDVTTTSYEKTFDENSLQENQELIEVETITKGASTAKTTCDILGVSTAQPGNQYTFTYTSNIASPTITWSIVSGAITLISTSGNSATFQFSSGFSGGAIEADGDNGTFHCNEIKNILSTAPTVTCPTTSCLSIFEVDVCTDFQAVLNCANGVASVQWEYSIGPYSHVSFGSSSNSGGNYSITKPLYLPSGSWDNFYLWIFANVTLTNGSTCTVANKILLDCDSQGGGNQ